MSEPPPVPPFRIDTEVDRSGATVTVRIAGELDLLHADDLLEHLRSVTRPDPGTPHRTPAHLVVDLSRVTFLSSRGLGALVEAQRDHASLHLTGVTGHRAVERVIDVAGLTDFFTIGLRPRP